MSLSLSLSKPLTILSLNDLPLIMSWVRPISSKNLIKNLLNSLCFNILCLDHVLLLLYAWITS